MLSQEPEIVKRKSLLEQDINCKLTITSGDRSEEKNKEVGGSSNSYHLKPGMAIDVVKDKDCKLTYKEIGSRAKPYFKGIIWYKKHIHLDLRKKPVFFEGRYFK